MPTSFSEQEAIQARIDAATKDERGCMRADAEARLAQINLLMNHKLLSRDERKSGDIAIEILCRLDATERRKGWWYRAKRRLQLTQMYLGS
jgi:hypothetical protein